MRSVQPIWSVDLDDGRTIRYGEGVIFRDLPLDRVRRLTVDVWHQRHEVILDSAMRPIYFVQHEVDLNPNTGVSERRSVVCVGWQTTTHGRNVKALSWITADGRVVQTDGEWTGWSADGSG